jgi:hypothetical protein
MKSVPSFDILVKYMGREPKCMQEKSMSVNSDYHCSISQTIDSNLRLFSTLSEKIKGVTQNNKMHLTPKME